MPCDHPGNEVQRFECITYKYRERITHKCIIGYCTKCNYYVEYISKPGQGKNRVNKIINNIHKYYEDYNTNNRCTHENKLLPHLESKYKEILDLLTKNFPFQTVDGHIMIYNMIAQYMYY